MGGVSPGCTLPMVCLVEQEVRVKREAWGGEKREEEEGEGGREGDHGEEIGSGAWQKTRKERAAIWQEVWRPGKMKHRSRKEELADTRANRLQAATTSPKAKTRLKTERSAASRVSPETVDNIHYLWAANSSDWASVFREKPAFKHVLFWEFGEKQRAIKLLLTRTDERD